MCASITKYIYIYTNIFKFLTNFDKYLKAFKNIYIVKTSFLLSHSTISISNLKLSHHISSNKKNFVQRKLSLSNRMWLSWPQCLYSNVWLRNLRSCCPWINFHSITSRSFEISYPSISPIRSNYPKSPTCSAFTLQYSVTIIIPSFHWMPRVNK